MPTFNDVAPAEWLRATAFKEGEEKTLTISAWTAGEFKRSDGKVRKTVDLHFAETPSKLGIANKVNMNSLNEIFGDGYDLDSIIGKRITLYTIIAEVSGEPTRAIRIKKPGTKSKASNPEPDGVDMDDGSGTA